MRVFVRIGWMLFLLAVILSCSTRALASESTPARLPLVFEPNRGQAREDVRYLLHGGVLSGEFRPGSVSLNLPANKDTASQVRMQLVGVQKDGKLEGVGVLEGHTNYLLGNDPAHWLRALPNYAQVRYSEIYPGIDLLFYGNGRVLEHDFTVRPGADLSRIAFRLDGAEDVTLTAHGDLQIKLAGGAITFNRPIAYQTVAGVRRNVEANFVLDRGGVVRFRLGRYDVLAKLIIDPALSFATYLDALSDGVDALAADASGNTYITGYTFNSTFPVTSDAVNQQCAACANNTAAVYVTKLNAAGTAQIYSTFLGGSAYNQPVGLAVDANGNAVVTGRTSSTDFPMKNPISAGLPSGDDGFVTSLSPDGSSLNFSSLLGGTSIQGTSASTYPGGIAVDRSGNVFVAGTTQSAHLPVTPGALDAGIPSYGTDSYVFLTKLQQSGNLAYSALLGDIGSASECCYVTGVAADSAGNAYVVGTVGVTLASYATPNPVTPWPVTTGAYQSTMIPPGDTAPFAAKVSADGSTLLYSTLVADGLTGGMALTPADQVILVGTPGNNFPLTSNANNSTGGTSFIATLSADGSQLLYSSYFGGKQSYPGSSTNAVVLDMQGNIWLAGLTRDSTFPLVNPLVAQLPPSPFGESVTSFLSEFDPTGTQLKFSTFMGDLSGSGLQIALDSDGKVHAAGTTTAPIYTTAGAFIGAVTAPPTDVEYTYPYATLIDPNASSATLCLSGAASSGVSFGYLIPQTTLTQSVQVTSCGSAPLTISSIISSNAAFTVPAGSNGCTGSIAGGSSCTVSVVFAPTAAQTYTGQLTFTSNASIAITSIPLNGAGGEPSAGFGPPGETQYLEFSPMLVGQTSSPLLIRLYNNGPAPLTINLAQISVTSGFQLAPGGTCTATLPAGQYCWINVVFAPTTAGTISGTLSVSSNDPVHPTVTTSLTGTAFATYPIATITVLLNPSYPINSGTTPITMDVDGTNFFPVSVVYINGVAQTTAYQSGTFLTVTFNPSLLNAVGQIPVTVVNPTPGGGSSTPYPLIGYLSIPLTASALTVDPVGGLLYAAIPANAAQNPSTVIPINPATGAMMTPITVSGDPRALAVSDDGSELYVASVGVLQRFNVKTLVLEKTFNLPVDSDYVQEMHVVPGSPKSIVLELFASDISPEEDGAALYNDSGLVNWLPGVSAIGSSSSRPLEMDSFTFTSSSMIYGLPEPELGTVFFEVPVTPSGLSYSGTTSGETSVPASSKVRSDGTLLYTNSGEVWNPSTMTLLGTYLEAGGSQIFYAPSVIPETSTGHTYFLDTDSQYSDYEAVNIDVYDQSSYALVGSVPFTGIYPPDVTDLVRWGTNGFAFRSVDITGSQPAANQIVIVTSNLVGPSTGAPVPILSSVSPSSVYASGPAYTMQVNGSGFTSASTVLVNGNPRSTTYTSGTSLTAQVLASDIASVGQFEVQVTTPAPDGGTSNYMVVSVTASPKTPPTVTVAPSSTNITMAQALAVTVAVSGPSGNPVPTGTVTLSSGSYTSAAATLSSGSATIDIQADTLAGGSYTFTATYIPDSGGSSTYISATGMSTAVTVTQATQTITFPTIPGQTVGTPLTLSATASSGLAVTFTLATTSICTVSGTTVSFIAPGTCTIDANQAGSSAYAAAPQVQQSFSVNAAPTFTGSGGGGSISIEPGATTGNTMTISVTPSNGFTGSVGLHCSISPAAASDPATCSFAPPSVTISGNTAQTSTLTINTTSAVSSANQMKRLFWPTAGGTVLAVVLLFWVPRRRRNWLAILGLLVLFASIGELGCGGGGGSGGGGGNTGTTPGTYTVTVTGTSGSLTVTLGTVSLIVQ
jgi:hypothetical protein